MRSSPKNSASDTANSLEINLIEVNGGHLINGEEDRVFHYFASRLSAFA
jgi:hypothetical protein